MSIYKRGNRIGYKFMWDGEARANSRNSETIEWRGRWKLHIAQRLPRERLESREKKSAPRLAIDSLEIGSRCEGINFSQDLGLLLPAAPTGHRDL